MNPQTLIDETCENAFEGSPLRGAARAEARRELASHLYERAAEIAAGTPGIEHVRQAVQSTDMAAFTHGNEMHAPGWKAVPQTVASRSRRLGAFAIDMAVVGLATALILAPFVGSAAAFGYIDHDTPEYECRAFFGMGVSFMAYSRAPAGVQTPCEEAAANSGIAAVALGAVALLYFGLMEGARGQTLGKMATKIRAARPDGSALGYGAAFGRNVVKGVPLLQLVDMLWWFEGRRQRLLDRWAQTVVVRA